MNKVKLQEINAEIMNLEIARKGLYDKLFTLEIKIEGQKRINAISENNLLLDIYSDKELKNEATRKAKFNLACITDEALFEDREKLSNLMIDTKHIELSLRENLTMINYNKRLFEIYNKDAE